MSFEDLDKKIKDAAEQHHPPYDENAWRKMEKLLDQHLPQTKEDKRRFALLFLLFLLVGGGIFIAVSRPWNKHSQTAEKIQTVQPTKQDKTIPVPLNTINTAKENHSELTNTKEPKENKLKESILLPGIITNKKHISPATTVQPKPSLVQKQNIPPQKQISTSQKNIADSKTVVFNGSSDQKNPDEGMKPPEVNSKSIVSTQPEMNTTITNKTTAENKTNPENTQKEEITKTQNNRQNKKASSIKSNNGFAFTVSTGADASKAGGSKLGKTTLLLGGGVSYTKKRFTFHTGIYAAKKIYEANANDYKLSYSPPYGTTFQGATANCFVLEIPLGMAYNFWSGKKGNWYASTGLSSYIMKSEKYNYNYKTSSGWTYSYKHDVKNKNKHYFSVLDLSFGYSRQINNVFSIAAEPYLRVPMKGIGEGKVHLNSGGIMITTSIHPFKSHKK